MTETSASFAGNTAEDYINKPASCGPSPTVGAMRVMDAEGTRELPVGEVGELWVGGPSKCRSVSCSGATRCYAIPPASS